MVLTTFRIGKPQDNHVLSHPAFAFGDCGAEAQGQAFFPQERITAVAGAVRPDGIFIREMADIFLFHRRAGPGNVLLPFFQGSSDRVETWNKILTFVEEVNQFPADTRHDVHITDDIRTVGNLHGYLRPGRTDRPHGEGDDVQGAAFHTAFVKRQHGRF